ncbi:hypothetical protein HBI24_116780 [Parastagonospora nodorum]|nr:hypothetical protein HBH43_178570 [Parastagonospora nodorum]KAH4222925.1 hypothetical protein HBI06_140260 [Parastagonospora nodorum]KAH4240461.1 hypothetical protein HBI05_108490 [Parastagonospora nodorum]KAH4262814.1 hypothetical protein HBI03_104290 [Parastagonospora nodorum]KAH4275147.1 hypothetical protein HBI04_130100 [Parastagonospora nodorum]
MCSLLRQGASLARSSPEDTAAVEAPEPKAIIISGPSQDQDPSNSITNCSITYRYLPRSFARVGGAALQRISECQLATGNPRVVGRVCYTSQAELGQGDQRKGRLLMPCNEK